MESLQKKECPRVGGVVRWDLFQTEDRNGGSGRGKIRKGGTKGPETFVFWTEDGTPRNVPFVVDEKEDPL